MCPDWEENPQIFGLWKRLQPTEPHRPGYISFLNESWLLIFKLHFAQPNTNYQTHFASGKDEAMANKEDCPRHIATAFALKQHGTQKPLWMA